MAYSEEQKKQSFEYILSEIEKGRSLRSVLEDENMPSSSTFFIWLDESEEKSKQYARATTLRADFLFDELLHIAYTTEEGETITEKGNGQTEISKGDMLGHRRLKVDALKWALSKMNPKKYGEKIDHTTGGDKIQSSVPSILIINPNNPE